MSLKTYRAKRDLKKSHEPKGKKYSKKNENLPVFCIQKHAASHLHYDFRIEYKGVLLSWAIPKGPSLNPKDKRLAIRVEDHPFDYRHFEGVIPKGNYGAGTVMIWDEGTYSIPPETTFKDIERAVNQGLEKGHLEIELHGSKLKGGFVLVKLQNDDKSWLFFKKKDEFESKEEVLSMDISARSERSMTEIGGNQTTQKGVKLKKIPQKIKPMLAKLVEAPFDDDAWIFETKWDGYRSLAYIQNKSVNLYSRNYLSFNDTFKPVREDLQQIAETCILDGEIVILDKEGKSKFQLMQNYQKNKQGNLFYYVFDILYYKDRDLRDLPLIERKEILKQLLEKYQLSIVRYSEYIENQGITFFKMADKYGLEGIMGKKKESPYLSKRSDSWVKIKTHKRQEAVIGGFTAPRGSRKHFGALLLGVYEDQKLVYIGHTGGGFNTKLLSDVYKKMQQLIQKKSPFSTVPKPNAAVTWVKPVLVCEIAFAEWTTEGIARQPIFQGLRMDKKAQQVHREKEMPLSPKTKRVATKLSNPEKIYWPKEGYTKQDLLNYYKTVSSVIIPYLKYRPLILHRYPEGIEGESFYQKETKMLNLPSYIKTIPVEHDEKVVTYLMVQNQKTLEYVVNLGSIELHPFMSRIKDLHKPDYLVIDLDPVDLPFDIVIDTALAIHKLFEELQIDHYCKTSGGRGLHIYIPLNGKYDFEQVKHFREILAYLIHQKLPQTTSLERKPANRQKKVYIDVIQNNPGQSVVAPYSVRARPGATVSTPLDWKEVKPGLSPSDFTIQTVPARIKQKGDLFKPILGKGIDLRSILKHINL